MNSCMRVYAGRGPLVSFESNMSCTISTFLMRASVLGDSEEVPLISKRAAFLLRGNEIREVPLWECVAIVCGRDAEGIIEGAADGTTEGVLDGLRMKVGGWTKVLEADRVTRWEEAGVAVFFSFAFPFHVLGGGGGSSMTSGSWKGTMISWGTLLTRLAKRGFSSPCSNPPEQSKYHPQPASEAQETWLFAWLYTHKG